jgi:5-methylcytosine-specific restriction endonuclease McrA
MKRDKLDAEWSNAVRARDGWKCQRCGRWFPEGTRRGLDAAHIWSRRIKRTRHDLDNGVALCTGCHMSWAHARPPEFHEWARKRLGARKYNALKIRALRIAK